MLIKTSTILASAIFTLVQNPRAAQQKQWLLFAAIAASLILYGMYRGISIQKHPDQPLVTTEDTGHRTASSTPRWSYDEIAHKLIMENTDLTCAEISRGFSAGVGHALIKITRHADGRPVILNM
nr:hypothetical protein [uncultured Dyadobacter sp.]